MTITLRIIFLILALLGLKMYFDLAKDQCGTCKKDMKVVVGFLFLGILLPKICLLIAILIVLYNKFKK